VKIWQHNGVNKLFCGPQIKLTKPSSDVKSHPFAMQFAFPMLVGGSDYYVILANPFEEEKNYHLLLMKPLLSFTSYRLHQLL
jgi:hypothetical protein